MPRAVTLEVELEETRKLVSKLNENSRGYRDEIHRLKSKLVAVEQKAEHFDILLTAVNEHEMVKAAWDRFMVTLRMCGYDERK
jgi:hypothetical protein